MAVGKELNERYKFIFAVYIRYVLEQWRRLLTLLPECQSEIIQLHPDLTSCDISIKK